MNGAKRKSTETHSRTTSQSLDQSSKTEEIVSKMAFYKGLQMQGSAEESEKNPADCARRRCKKSILLSFPA